MVQSYLQSVISITLLATSAVAHPADGVHLLSKRAFPQISNVIDENNAALLRPAPDFPTAGALPEANQLLSYAIDTGDNVIFAKYFDPVDRTYVTDIFRRLLGNNQGGADEFTGLTITEGDIPTDPEDPDDPGAPAELRDFTTANPTIVFQQNDDFIYVKGNRDTNPDACDVWAEGGMSTDMYIIASVLLHEYIHWDWLLANVNGHQPIVDYTVRNDGVSGYGFRNARALARNMARTNADSFAWFATENLWAVLCGSDGGYNDMGAD